MIRGVGHGAVAEAFLKVHLNLEVKLNSNIWFSRVPTEANLADLPSRLEGHPLLERSFDHSGSALKCLGVFLKEAELARTKQQQKGEGMQLRSPQVAKRPHRCISWQSNQIFSSWHTESNGVAIGKPSNWRVWHVSFQSIRRDWTKGGVGGLTNCELKWSKKTHPLPPLFCPFLDFTET